MVGPCLEGHRVVELLVHGGLLDDRNSHVLARGHDIGRPLVVPPYGYANYFGQRPVTWAILAAAAS